MVLPPNIPDIALEKIQADYHASELKDKYRLEKTAFILDAVDENAIQAEVGNKNSDSFEPSLTLRKWNDEVNFKVKYKHAEKEKDQKVDIENKKIKWKGKKTEVHYYDIKKGELLHDKILESDVFEVEVILLEKPDTNIVGFDIETTGLSFYYQPELTQEEKDDPNLIKKTRISRIAKGSGTTYTEVKGLLKQWNTMNTMMKGLLGKKRRGKRGQQMPGMPGMGMDGELPQGMDLQQAQQMMAGAQKKKRKKHPW